MVAAGSLLTDKKTLEYVGSASVPVHHSISREAAMDQMNCLGTILRHNQGRTQEARRSHESAHAALARVCQVSTSGENAVLLTDHKWNFSVLRKAAIPAFFFEFFARIFTDNLRVVEHAGAVKVSFQIERDVRQGFPAMVLLFT